MTQQDKQRLAAEFNRLVTALVGAATIREIGDRRDALEAFTVCEILPIAAALTEWAQQRRTNMSSKPTIAELEAILASPPGTFRTKISPSGEISAVRCADGTSDRRRALEEAEQVCRARGLGCSPPDDADPDSIVEAQIRASEARACADAIARRAAEGAP